jgi:hypothetical protein
MIPRRAFTQCGHDPLYRRGFHPVGIHPVGLSPGAGITPTDAGMTPAKVGMTHFIDWAFAQ